MRINLEMIKCSLQQSALDDLDAVINQAETDSTYSSAKSRQSIKSQLLEQERDELEKILQLEKEIEEMHRQTEVRAQAATQLQVIIKSSSSSSYSNLLIATSYERNYQRRDGY